MVAFSPGSRKLDLLQTNKTVVGHKLNGSELHTTLNKNFVKNSYRPSESESESMIKLLVSHLLLGLESEELVPFLGTNDVTERSFVIFIVTDERNAVDRMGVVDTLKYNILNRSNIITKI